MASAAVGDVPNWWVGPVGTVGFALGQRNAKGRHRRRRGSGRCWPGLVGCFQSRCAGLDRFRRFGPAELVSLVYLAEMGCRLVVCV